MLRELIGGELLCAVVLRRDGSRQGMRLWNRLPGGVEIDLTRYSGTGCAACSACRRTEWFTPDPAPGR